MSLPAPNIREPIVDEEGRVTNRWWSWFNSLTQGTRFSGTITVAKLTAGGANGSMTFQNGVLVSQTPAT
jgi:hypothetical protein